MSTRIVIASGNKGKIKELQALFNTLPYELVPQSDYSIEDIEETGLTFIENAILKARNAAQHTGLPALADDSGLCVDALNGAPGIYSARYAGPTATNEQRIAKLLDAIKDVSDDKRTVSFHCVLAYLRWAEDPSPIICHGIWTGTALHEPRGTQGFGYDPLFFDLEHQCSAAELDPDVKNKISHRGKAIAKLFTALAQ